jgi:hypothetical protein
VQFSHTIILNCCAWSNWVFMTNLLVLSVLDGYALFFWWFGPLPIGWEHWYYTCVGDLLHTAVRTDGPGPIDCLFQARKFSRLPLCYVFHSYINSADEIASLNIYPLRSVSRFLEQYRPEPWIKRRLLLVSYFGTDFRSLITQIFP